MIEDILAPIKLELQTNLESLEGLNLPCPERYHAQYYDPTAQYFKFRDDALTHALAVPSLFNQLNPSLAEMLLLVSKHVRFLNMQIDELLAFRFGDPVMLAEARAYMLRQIRRGREFPPEKLPSQFSAWFRELALRHWAIVNEGFHKRLRHSLPQAIHLCNQEWKGEKYPCPACDANLGSGFGPNNLTRTCRCGTEVFWAAGLPGNWKRYRTFSDVIMDGWIDR